MLFISLIEKSTTMTFKMKTFPCLKAALNATGLAHPYLHVSYNCRRVEQN